MAFGFQNCCDSNEYFYVNNIPNTVSEYEVYYIDTLEDLDFCASYVELPELFYQPRTYNLRGMTAQTNCTSCITINPCPDLIDDNIDDAFTYVTTTSNECFVVTETFFEVYCVQTTVPTISNPNGGVVSLNISGGVPPYLIYSAGTTTLLSTANQPGTNTVLTNKPGGTYSLTVQDFILNSQSINCTLPTAPTVLAATCNVINVTGYFGNTNGVINQPTVNGGTQPYTYWSGSTQITSFPINNRPAGTYPITVKDSGTGPNFQQLNLSCVITEPPQVNYPSNLCMSFEFCGTGFLINFVSAGTLNGKAYYTPDAAGRTALGINNGMQLKWDNTQSRWNTTNMVKASTISLAGLCTQTGNQTVQFNGPTTVQPTGSWSPVSTSFYNNDGQGVTTINVTEGPCTSSPLSVSYAINDGCVASGTITFTVSNGTPPYIVYLGGTPYGNNLTITNLVEGSYSYSITDSANRTASGTFSIDTTFNATINLSVNATFNTANDSWQDLSGPLTRTKLIGRRYDVTINSTGLDPGEQIQGYFVVIYKQLALYKTTNITFPDYPYDTTVYEPNVTWQLINESGSLSGYRWKKNGTIIPNDYSDESVQNSLGNRKCPSNTLCSIVQVLPSIMTSALNNSCPTSSNQAGVAALYYTVGTSTNPITIDSNTTITGNLPTSFRWRPNASGYNSFVPETSCPRAYAEDWDIYFVQVGALPTCKTLAFNNSPYTISNPSSTIYRRSFAVVDNMAGSQNTLAAVYNNGTPWSAVAPDSTQRVASYY